LILPKFIKALLSKLNNNANKYDSKLTMMKFDAEMLRIN